MSVSAFVVKVPAAERLVGELRMRFDASCKLGAPAHITVLFPFMSAAEITPFVVRRAQVALGDVPSFSFSLGEAIGRFLGPSRTGSSAAAARHRHPVNFSSGQSVAERERRQARQTRPSL